MDFADSSRLDGQKSGSDILSDGKASSIKDFHCSTWALDGFLLRPVIGVGLLTGNTACGTSDILFLDIFWWSFTGEDELLFLRNIVEFG